MTHIADNHDALLDYLYEEGEPAERLKIARHLQECAACSVAVLEFQTVRGMLSEWTPPASQLGFRIVQDEPAQAACTAPRAGGVRRAESALGAGGRRCPVVCRRHGGVAARRRLCRRRAHRADALRWSTAPAIRNASIGCLHRGEAVGVRRRASRATGTGAGSRDRPSADERVAAASAGDDRAERIAAAAGARASAVAGRSRSRHAAEGRPAAHPAESRPVRDADGRADRSAAARSWTISCAPRGARSESHPTRRGRRWRF